jgi:hypothetical protein
MYTTEDGAVVGSIDRAALAEVKPKDEDAKATLGQLQAEAEAAETAAEPDADDDSGDELDQLRAEAEAAGVKVDKRWGADRLREEIDTAKAGGQS